MRICVASHKECWRAPDGRYYSYGGFPRQMEAIASLCDELSLLLVAGAPRAGGIPLPAPARVRLLRKPAGTDTRRKLSILLDLGYYLGELRHAFQDADAVHLPLPGDISLLGLMVALSSRKPLLARYGGSWADNAETTLMNRVTRQLMRRFAGGRNVMLATGEGSLPPAPRMHWIFSTAITESELAGIVPVTRATLQRPPVLIYAGRLAQEKGVDVLLRALARLTGTAGDSGPRLLVAGDGPERPALEALAQSLGVGAAVSFLGQVGREALSSAFASADICVQPSRTEGFSKAWLDAMAHGVPLVASDVGAAAAVAGSAGERGWLVQPGDSDALASTLHEVLYSARDWASLRRRCREYAESRTLEAWSRELAAHCRTAWDLPVRDGLVEMAGIGAG